MKNWIKICMAVLLVLAFLPAMPARAQSELGCTDSGEQASGALYCLATLPPGYWNGDLVIFAHGYVSVFDPLKIPWDQMTFTNGLNQSITLPQIVNSLGYDFATTSYSVNGLAVKQGIADILDLINVYKNETGKQPDHIYLVGASEGGLVTTLSIEKYPQAFSGGMELCGPVGSFTGQVNYWGDFRVVFDYMMDTPSFDVLPGNAINIPHVLMSKWDSYYSPLIVTTMQSNLLGVNQMMNVTKAPFDPADMSTIGATTLGILWYNVFATNDAIDKLGGQPFDNRDRVYAGSLNDSLLNADIKRFKANAAALAEIAANYETSGILMKPLVAMHTTGDPIVPFWQMTGYTAKVAAAPTPIHPYYPITVQRYGHCKFELNEMLTGFGTLVTMVTGLPPVLPPMLQNSPIDAGVFMLNR